jgi:arylsulfatase A-like enzyme
VPVRFFCACGKIGVQFAPAGARSRVRGNSTHPIISMSVRILLMAAAITLLPVVQAQPAARTNILFIAVDDLNDWVGFLQGHPQARTPNMDRLAARGIAFANASCPAPLCGPVRAAVFSGHEPYRTGVYDNDDDIRRLAPKLVLMPTHFQAQGYRTFGTGKLLHQRRPELYDESFMPEQRWSPFERGQVDYTPEELPSKGTDNPRHVIPMGPGKPPVILPLNRMPSDRRPDSPTAESFDWGPVDVPDSAMGDAQVAGWAAQHLSTPQSRPFFLAVGFYRPHIPLFAPAKYFEPFPADAVTLPPFRPDDLDDLGEVARRIALDAVTAGSHASVVKYHQWRAAVAAYLACVYFVDAQIGRVIDALESGPHADNTVVVLWGDHGWHLGEKQHWGKWTGWERSVRVPLVVAPAARDRAKYAVGGVSWQPVSLMDLYPTLVDLAALPAPVTGLDGQSLVPVMRQPDRATGRAVVSTFYGEHFSVRDERWRYLRYSDGAEELYDHAADPNEWHNVAGKPEHAGVKRRLAAAIPANPVPKKAGARR